MRGPVMRPLTIFSKARIGTKLGLLMGNGIVRVPGMIVNEQLSSKTIERLITAADQQQTIALQSVNTELTLQLAQVVGRDLVISRSPENVEIIRATLRKIASDGAAQLANLEVQSADPTHRERVAKIEAQFRNHVATLNEIADKQVEILALFHKRDQATSKWTRSVTTVLNSGSFGTLPNYKEVEGFVNEAASAFKDARTAAWSYFVLREPAQSRLIDIAISEVVVQLNYARTAADHEGVRKGIDGLLAIVPEFKTVLNETIETINVQDRLQSERVAPAELATHKLLAEATAVAGRLAEAATMEAAAATQRAARIRVAVGLVVVLLLIGAAAFASLTIARPIRRIGEVLVELASGRKDVAIPYVRRSDEVGDNARAAQTFKDSLQRMEELEREREEVEARSAATRLAPT